MSFVFMLTIFELSYPKIRDEDFSFRMQLNIFSLILKLTCIKIYCKKT